MKKSHLLRVGCACLLTLGVFIPAKAAVIQYSGFSDFQSSTITSDAGGGISTSVNYTTNSSFASNSGDNGAGSSGPMEFSEFSAYEVGMMFGNDQACCGSSGFFDVTLTVFDGLTLLGSVVVSSNGNDLADQFIGLGSDAAFNKVTLSYGDGSASLTRFINRIDIGYDAISSVPIPPALWLFGSGLLGLVGMARRKKA